MTAPLPIIHTEPAKSIQEAHKTKVRRDSTVDIMRGTAIFCMVAANLAGDLLQEPHPFLFRFYGTFAAPMFITLAGFMVGLKGGKDHGFSYYLLRGALLVLIASLIDVLVWQYYPLTSFDVLYLIGVSMPIAYLVSRLPQAGQWVCALLVFALTPLVQSTLGYVQNGLDVSLSQVPPSVWLAQFPVITRHFLADGWFPVFPWVGFALLGVSLSSLRGALQDTFDSMARWAGPLLLAVGAIAWWLHPGPLYTREGYSELFYPATYGYMLTAAGVIVSAFSLVSKLKDRAFLKPWQVLGQCSLLIYILHYTLIRYALDPLFGPKMAFVPFLGLYGLLLAVLFGVAYGIRRFKQHSPKNPFLLQFLIGG